MRFKARDGRFLSGRMLTEPGIIGQFTSGEVFDKYLFGSSFRIFIFRI
jgi:hypothetical protein